MGSLLSPGAALANDDAPSALRRSYAPQEFDRFAPRTALDMANQIPGFSIREGGDDRGLGQADTNVLINGRRISGKSNGPLAALGRVPADDVVRLEILDGASLEIAGLSGQVLNVVTGSTGDVNGRFRYEPQFRTRGAPFRWGNGEVSLSGGGERTEWTVSFENEQWRFNDSGPEFVYDGAGALIETRQENNNRNIDRPILSGSFTRTAANGNVLNLTGETQAFFLRGTETSQRDIGGADANTRVLRQTEDEYNYEIGGDYEFSALSGRLKLIGLYRYENSPTVGAVTFSFDDGSPDAGSVFERQANEAELIARAEYSVNALSADWQLAVEGARNFLDIDSSLQVRDAVGVLAPAPLPGASSRVEEDRAETTLSVSRALSPNWQLQSSLGVEYSEIRQSGQFGLTRDFVRPKGSLSLNWRPSDKTNVSAKLERVVGQLNFFDFIASVNVNQDQVNVSNANLVPPQSWLFEVEFQQAFDALGSLTVRGFYEDITDIVDQIPIETGGQAPGNIDAASRFGATLDATILSEPFGWRGARVDISVAYADSSVVDPLTQASRRISDEDYFDLEAEFRQDFPDTDWAFGFSVSHEEDTPQVRLDEISVVKESFAFGQAYVENKDVAGLTLRASVSNVLDRDNDFFRTVFNDRLTNDVLFREERFRNFGTIFTFTVEGSF